MIRFVIPEPIIYSPSRSRRGTWHIEEVPLPTEPAAAGRHVIDSDPVVWAFVKNAGLGFAMPHLHNGRPHDDIQDFIVRFKDRPDFHLILETKGCDELAGVKAAAAERWVTAVNADGQHGTWRYVLARSIEEVQTILAAVAASTRA